MGPGIQRRDVNAVAVHADLDAVVDDGPERRADVTVGSVRRDPSVRGHLHAAPERLQRDRADRR